MNQRRGLPRRRKADSVHCDVAARWRRMGVSFVDTSQVAALIPGFPDFVVELGKHLPYLAFVELKSDATKRLTEPQKLFAAKWRAHWYRVDGADEAAALIQRKDPP